MIDEQNTLLQVDHLVKHFRISYGSMFNRRRGVVHAVDDVSFTIRQGETFGLVGESGCGKSTTGRTILQLYRPTSGSVYFEGVDLAKLSKSELIPMRQKMQMIFQDPSACLNPRMTVGEIISDPLWVNQRQRGSKAITEEVHHLLELVKMNPSLTSRYAHEFSGGQRQRIGIARALALRPKLIICDEPISALDVSIQAQVVNLLEDLQSQFNLTYLFIAHDLSMVRHICDRVASMYLGTIVELADRKEFYNHPFHPYTEALLSAVPIPDPTVEEHRKRIILKGEVPSPIHPPSGCRFHPRCNFAKEICTKERPPLVEHRPGHFVACHFPLEY